MRVNGKIGVEIVRKHSLMLSELIEELENYDTLEIPNSITIFPPDNSNDPVTDKDLGEEDNIVIDNLPGSQLRVECEAEGKVDSSDEWDSEDELPLTAVAPFAFTAYKPLRRLTHRLDTVDHAAGPSRASSRAKKQKISHDSYCGLSDAEVRNILSVMDVDDHEINEDEPFIDSGSEYVPQTDSESEGWGSQESDLEEENQVETDDEMNLDNYSGDIEPIEIVWNQRDFRPKKHEFDNSSSGVRNENLFNETLEVNYFLNLFTEELATIIIAETNRYAQEREAKGWKDIDISELFVFISLTLLMPHMKKTDIKDYWSKDSLMHTPIFGEKMSRDRYLTILRYLFSNNAEGNRNDRTRKLGVVLNTIKTQFQTQFYPFENLVIDESMILFKGRLSFKQYIKTKRHRFGIKLYVLCDCETGFVLDFLVYIGKNTDITLIDNLGSSGSVVVKLLEPYLNKGHTFYSDNYYTSPSLSIYLYITKPILRNCPAKQIPSSKN
ncbi:hypothetical protein NQ318_016178 [Aromia moschata]|uniref:PiggyBac transposable element-derived protein domain-containing protein n=1 Tax=Aromia moschata TaxID=1265417 RepID=A0AAV8X7E9_9CUCU|nr:hypothetical protein NQ318_016178 [Aromia moschata]